MFQFFPHEYDNEYKEVDGSDNCNVLRKAELLGSHNCWFAKHDQDTHHSERPNRCQNVPRLNMSIAGTLITGTITTPTTALAASEMRNTASVKFLILRTVSRERVRPGSFSVQLGRF
eukprot:scaffold37095_cov183-Amphora_coffeaeformis.AAC.1